MSFLKKAALLSLPVIIILITACSGYDDGSNGGISGIDKTKDVSGSDQVDYDNLTAEQWLATLDGGDYGGYEFSIATSKPYRFMPEEEMTGMVNPAVEKRNKLVNAKYNIKITEVYLDESEIQSSLSNSVNAGIQYSDLVSVTMPTMAGLAASGYLMNLFSVPFFNESAVYLNSDIVSHSTVNDYLYAIYDQISFYQEEFWCVFYNEDLLSENAGKEITAAVKTGKWTWDMLMGYAESAASEVMQKRSPDYQTDIFGIGSYGSGDELAVAAFASSGLSLFGDTFHKSLAYSMNADEGDAVADKIRGAINSKSYLNLDGDKASKAFLDGRLAFFIYCVNFAKAAADAGFNWNIAPLPKLTENQSEYYSYIGATSAGLSVPEMQTDSARTGKVLNALCAASYINIEEALKTNYITFCLRDNDAAIILSTIFKNPVIDIGTIYSEGYGNLSYLSDDTILEAVNNDEAFSYMYENKKSALEKLNSNEFR